MKISLKFVLAPILLCSFVSYAMERQLAEAEKMETLMSAVVGFHLPDEKELDELITNLCDPNSAEKIAIQIQAMGKNYAAAALVPLFRAKDYSQKMEWLHGI